MWQQQRCGSESAEGHTGIPSTAALTDMKITSCGCGPVHKAVTVRRALLPLCRSIARTEKKNSVALM